MLILFILFKLCISLSNSNKFQIDRPEFFQIKKGIRLGDAPRTLLRIPPGTYIIHFNLSAHIDVRFPKTEVNLIIVTEDSKIGETRKFNNNKLITSFGNYDIKNEVDKKNGFFVQYNAVTFNESTNFSATYNFSGQSNSEIDRLTNILRRNSNKIDVISIQGYVRVMRIKKNEEKGLNAKIPRLTAPLSNEDFIYNHEFETHCNGDLCEAIVS